MVAPMSKQPQNKNLDSFLGLNKAEEKPSEIAHSDFVEQQEIPKPVAPPVQEVVKEEKIQAQPVQQVQPQPQMLPKVQVAIEAREDSEKQAEK